MLTRVLAIAVCGAAGFFAASAFNSSSVVAEPRHTDGDPPVLSPMALPTAAESALIGEWEQLRATHGDDTAALYAAIKDTKDAFRRRAFRSALIADWSVRDPQAALAYILEKDSGNAQQLVREWMRRDPQAAVTGLLAGGENTRKQLRGLLDDIAKLAPSRLAEVVSVLGSAEGRWDTSVSNAFAIFAKDDTGAARISAEAMTGENRAQALAGVARAWGRKDGAAALAWAQSMPAGEARDQALKAVLGGWAMTDPVAALSRLDLVPPGGDEMYHASDTGAQVLRQAAIKDWDATIAWLRDNPGKLGPSSLNGLQDALGKRLGKDTAATMRLLTSGSFPGLENVFGNSVLNDGYAHRDAIWNWLDSQPSSDQTIRLRGSLLNAMGYKDPENALTFIDKIPDTPENASLFHMGLSSLFNGGSRMDLFEGLYEKAPERFRARLLEIGFQNGAKIMAGDPARWVARLNEIPSERRANAASGLAGAWATTDPAAAIKWATALPEDSGRDTALRSIANSWASTDPLDAAHWVDSLPQGPGRDNASQSIVMALARSEPQAAWDWAVSIKSEQLRFGSLQMAYLGLMKKDAATAEQMLNTSNLPPGLVKSLRESYQPGMENRIFPR